MSEPTPPENALRAVFGNQLDAMARTPTLAGRLRRAFDFPFPRVTLNAGDRDTVTVRTPGNAHFIVRQIYYSVTATSNPVALGTARISSASQRRPNFEWMSDLVPLELFAASNPRNPQYLAKPILIEPGSSVTLELKNITTSSHSYDLVLVGELVFDLSREEIEAFMSHSWFGFTASVTPSGGDVELRNHPDADFYIVSLNASRYGASNNVAQGHTRLLLRPSSQGEPLMDQAISTTLLCGSYYNLTAVPRTSLGPCPLPEPYLIEANASMLLSAVGGDSAAFNVFLEGVKVFK